MIIWGILNPIKPPTMEENTLTNTDLGIPSGVRTPPDEIDLAKLTFEEFRTKALDLPESEDPNYRQQHNVLIAMRCPYARDLCGWPLTNRFMYRLINQLKTDQIFLPKIYEFRNRINQNPDQIHKNLKIDWQQWSEALDAIQ